MQILKNVKEKLRNNKAVEKLHPFFINRYLFFRYLINNLFPNSFIDRNLEIRDFKYLEFETLYNKLNIKTSPSRRLSDLFWLTLPWAKIKDELGSLKILDTGCGSGIYGVKLMDYSNNNRTLFIFG